jgi:hypothetical protein
MIYAECCERGKKQIYYSDNFFRWLFDTEDGLAGIQVSFCPFCGKKLGAVEGVSETARTSPYGTVEIRITSPLPYPKEEK